MQGCWKTRGDAPGTGKLEELAGVGENYDGNLGFTENGKFLSLLEQPCSPLRERDLSAASIVDSFDLDFPSTHWLYFLALSEMRKHAQLNEELIRGGGGALGGEANSGLKIRTKTLSK